MFGSLFTSALVNGPKIKRAAVRAWDNDPRLRAVVDETAVRARRADVSRLLLAVVLGAGFAVFAVKGVLHNLLNMGQVLDGFWPAVRWVVFTTLFVFAVWAGARAARKAMSKLVVETILNEESTNAHRLTWQEAKAIRAEQRREAQMRDVVTGEVVDPEQMDHFQVYDSREHRAADTGYVSDGWR